FVNRTSELLDEGDRSWPYDFWRRRSKLRLFRFVVFSPLVRHEVSCSQINSAGPDLSLRSATSMRTSEHRRARRRAAAAVRKLPDIRGGERLFSRRPS